MNSGSSSISGVRTANLSRRDTRREPRVVARRLPVNIAVHLVLITLAVLVWWIARDMVAITLPLKNAARLKFELSDELKGKWRVMGPEARDGLPVSISVDGPMKKLNEFASELEVNPGRYDYIYRITPADLPADAGARKQVVIRIDPGQLRPSPESVAPAELSIKPLEADRPYQITLESYVTRQAFVDVKSGIVGEVPGYKHRVRAIPETMLEVHGPISRIEELLGTNDLARLTITRFDVALFVNNRVAAQKRPLAEVLQQESRVTAIAMLTPMPEVVVRQATAATTPGGPPAMSAVTQVPIEIVFTRDQDYANVEARFPVSVNLPLWLWQKGAQIRSGIDDEQTVRLQVLASQGADWEKNVSVVLDLGHLTESDLVIRRSEGSAKLVVAVPKVQLFYSLNISLDRAAYRLVGSETVSEANYVQVTTEVVIEWTE